MQVLQRSCNVMKDVMRDLWYLVGLCGLGCRGCVLCALAGSVPVADCKARRIVTMAFAKGRHRALATSFGEPLTLAVMHVTPYVLDAFG